MCKEKTSLLLLLIAFCLYANATELFVGPSQQYQIIQNAIDDAQNGDIVTIMDGTYVENLGITDLSITLRSYNGNENCIIDGNYTGHVISIESVNPEEETVIIQGFTIQNSGTDIEVHAGYWNNIFDSGIFVKYSSITIIQENNFLNNFCDIYLKATNEMVEISENSFNDILNTHIDARYIFCRSIENLIVNDNQFNNSFTSMANGLIFCFYGDNVTIKNNEITLIQGYFIDFRFITEINIMDNNIEYSGYNLHAGNALKFIESNFKLDNNSIIFDESCLSGHAITAETCPYKKGYFYNNLIIGCSTAITFNSGDGWTPNYHGFFRNNTFYSCGTVFDIDNEYSIGNQNNILEFKNNIIWDVNIMFDLHNHTLATPVTIEYSCLEGGVPTGVSFIDGDGNTSSNPQLTADYHLSSNSTDCIDLGDPDTDDDGISWIYDEDDRDVDGSRKDMGCYPYLHDYDTKTLPKGVHWISFPILCQDGTYNGIPHIPPINDQLYQQAYYDNGGGLLQLTSNSPGTIDGFQKILGKRDLTDMSITPDGNDYATFDDNFNNMLFRHEGYKISVGEVTNPTILIVGSSNDERLAEDHVIAGDMPYGEYHWIGYWLQEPKNIVDAFGGNSDNPADDLWQYVEKVKAEDWYYDRCTSGIRGEIPSVSWSTAGKTLEYGKMYMVWFLDHTVSDFEWYAPGDSEEPAKKIESEYFTYTELPDYEVIDVLNIPEEVIEIGVFEEETCLGAVVVQSTSEQILVYSDKANRDEIPFSFEIVTDLRGSNQPVNNYLVFNKNTGEFENGHIISGRQEHSIIKFGDISEPENESPAVNSVVLHNNYPNPFNPETTISFSLPSEQEVSLNIYNLKGQKVRELVDGRMVPGTYSVIWNGKNNNGKQVSSGLYLYKLKTEGKEFSRKMLLLK